MLAGVRAWCLAGVIGLAACAAMGPAVMPVSPLLEVPLAARARQGEIASMIAELQIKQDWAGLAALALGGLSVNPADDDLRIVLGFAQIQARNYPQAIAALEPIVARSPEEADAPNLLGEAYRLAGDRRSAVDVLELASFRHPNSVPARFLLGEVYRDDNRLDRARQAYGEAIRLEPEFSLAWMGLARVLARSGPRSAYEEALKRLQALDPALAQSLREEEHGIQGAGQRR